MKKLDKKAVLFDIDGTVHDTYEYIVQAFEYTLNKQGLPLKTRNLINETVGLTLVECYKMLAPSSNIDLLCEIHREFQRKNLDLVVPFKGAIETLRSLRKRGVKIAAVTARGKESTLINMQKTGIKSLMDVIVAKEDTVNQKPDPEPIFLALQLLAVEPSNALMVGDSDVDIEAGKRAKLKGTIGAAYGFRGLKILEFKPDKIIHDISEVLPITFESFNI